MGIRAAITTTPVHALLSALQLLNVTLHLINVKFDLMLLQIGLSHITA